MSWGLLLALLVASAVGLPRGCGQMTPPEVPPLGNTDVELVQVSVVFRHGDRIMYQDVPCWPNDLATYECQNRQLSTPSFLENQTTTDTDRLFRIKYMEDRNYYAGNCFTGELTNKGFTQEVNVGRMYRRLYVDSGLLSDQFDGSSIYMRSDMDDRCMQSLEAILEGMYPANATSPNLEIFDVNTMDKYYDNIAPNENLCPILEDYWNEFLTTPEYLDHYNRFTVPLFAALTEALGYEVKTWSTYSQVFDCLVVHACHEQPIPEGLTSKLYTAVMAESDWTYKRAYAYPSRQAFARAGSGFLLQEMSEFMLSVVQNTAEPQYKMLLYSAHDTTLAPFLAAFDQWPGLWPEYASQMQFELYRSISSGEFSMRVTYNGRELVLPGCTEPLCPWDAFYGFLQTVFPDGNC